MDQINEIHVVKHTKSMSKRPHASGTNQNRCSEALRDMRALLRIVYLSKCFQKKMDPTRPNLAGFRIEARQQLSNPGAGLRLLAETAICPRRSVVKETELHSLGIGLQYAITVHGLCSFNVRYFNGSPKKIGQVNLFVDNSAILFTSS